MSVDRRDRYERRKWAVRIGTSACDTVRHGARGTSKRTSLAPGLWTLLHWPPQRRPDRPGEFAAWNAGAVAGVRYDSGLGHTDDANGHAATGVAHGLAIVIGLFVNDEAVADYRVSAMECQWN